MYFSCAGEGVEVCALVTPPNLCLIGIKRDGWGIESEEGRASCLGGRAFEQQYLPRAMFVNEPSCDSVTLAHGVKGHQGLPCAGFISDLGASLGLKGSNS